MKNKNPKSRPSARMLKAGYKKTIMQHAGPQSLMLENTATESYTIAYDENLLEKYRGLWQSGDWEDLITLDSNILEHHPDRAKLALIIASAWLQLNDPVAARCFIKQARKWGCDKKLIAQLLIGGVHNTLGRAAMVNKDEPRIAKHFQLAVNCGGRVKQFENVIRYNREQLRLSLNNQQNLQESAAIANGHDSMPTIRRVVVTGDFLRPSPEGYLSQESNIRWLFAILEPQLRAVVDPRSEDESAVRCFFGDLELAHIVYTSLDLPFTESSWATVYNNALPLMAEEIIKNLIGEDKATLIVGFEMPPSVLDYLTNTRIPYINTRFSPYRYLDDLLLSFSSNVPEISRRLLDFDTPKPSLYLAASIEKQKRRSAVLSITQGALVFFGQAPRDASLIQSDTFISFNDYKESIISAANSVKARYYKPHPYLRDENAISFFHDIGFELVDDNAYDLLSSNALDVVMGLNSSVLYEAVCFKKKVFRLHPTDLYANSVHVYDSFLNLAFWAKVLGKDAPTGNLRSAGRPNLMRESLGAWWAK